METAQGTLEVAVRDEHLEDDRAELCVPRLCQRARGGQVGEGARRVPKACPSLGELECARGRYRMLGAEETRAHLVSLPEVGQGFLVPTAPEKALSPLPERTGELRALSVRRSRELEALRPELVGFSMGSTPRQRAHERAERHALRDSRARADALARGQCLVEQLLARRLVSLRDQEAGQVYQAERAGLRFVRVHALEHAVREAIEHLRLGEVSLLVNDSSEIEETERQLGVLVAGAGPDGDRPAEVGLRAGEIRAEKACAPGVSERHGEEWVIRLQCRFRDLQRFVDERLGDGLLVVLEAFPAEGDEGRNRVDVPASDEALADCELPLRERGGLGKASGGLLRLDRVGEGLRLGPGRAVALGYVNQAFERLDVTSRVPDAEARGTRCFAQPGVKRASFIECPLELALGNEGPYELVTCGGVVHAVRLRMLEGPLS